MDSVGVDGDSVFGVLVIVGSVMSSKWSMKIYILETNSVPNISILFYFTRKSGNKNFAIK